MNLASWESVAVRRQVVAASRWGILGRANGSIGTEWISSKFFTMGRRGLLTELCSISMLPEKAHKCITSEHGLQMSWEKT